MRAAFALLTLLLAGLSGCLGDQTSDDSETDSEKTWDRPQTIDPATLGESVYVFDVLDIDGTVTGQAAWRMAFGTGNCCENYVTTTAEGRILDFGGTFVKYSDDEGITWETVGTPIPYQTGEGAIVPAPGGDVVGIGWSPYTGDQAWGHKYEADTGLWSWAPAPIHTPFWDREWIAALPGPFNVNGQEVEYITLARGGTGYKEVLLMSLDGLNYQQISLPDFEVMLADSTVLDDLSTDPDPERDWMQPLRQMTIVPIGNGRGLQYNSGLGQGGEGGSCIGFFDSSASWSCLTLQEAFLPPGALLMDSVGGLHVMQNQGDGFTYHISHDGGRSWDAINWTLPYGMRVSDWDFKAHAALDQTIVAVHVATTSGNGQDLVYRFHGLDGTPVFDEIMLSSDGKAEVGGGGVSNQGDRFDFMNTAMLPDGRIVMSVQDSRFTSEGATISSNQGSSVSPVLMIELEI